MSRTSGWSEEGDFPRSRSQGDDIVWAVPTAPPSLSLPWQPVPAIVVTACVAKSIYMQAMQYQNPHKNCKISVDKVLHSAKNYYRSKSKWQAWAAKFYTINCILKHSLYLSNDMVVGVCHIENTTVTEHALRGVKLTLSLVSISESCYTTAIHTPDSSWEWVRSMKTRNNNQIIL